MKFSSHEIFSPFLITKRNRILFLRESSSHNRSRFPTQTRFIRFAGMGSTFQTFADLWQGSFAFCIGVRKGCGSASVKRSFCERIRRRCGQDSSVIFPAWLANAKSRVTTTFSLSPPEIYKRLRKLLYPFRFFFIRLLLSTFLPDMAPTNFSLTRSNDWQTGDSRNSSTLFSREIYPLSSMECYEQFIKDTFPWNRSCRVTGCFSRNIFFELNF